MVEWCLGKLSTLALIPNQTLLLKGALLLIAVAGLHGAIVDQRLADRSGVSHPDSSVPVPNVNSAAF